MTSGSKHDIERNPASDLRSFGRRRGRAHSARQQQLIAEVLPRLRWGSPHEIGWGQTPDADHRVENADADARGLTPADTWLEIGFGGGEHLIWQAERHPGVLLIGCEPFEDGVVKVLTAIEAKALANIRIHPDDARPLLRRLPEASIGRGFILFPDPWPKRRHAKRRLLSVALVDLLARVMRSGAELRIATDIGDYARTTLLAIQSQGGFRWTAASAGDWRSRPADWPQTRYERKALREGRRCYYFTFVRL
jgi:tRNA (guanine-N7-)-methyltransferase